MRSHLAWSLSLIVVLNSCEKADPVSLVFSPSDDIALGAQLHDEILADPATYPLLDETEYADAYTYLQGLCDQLVATGELQYDDEFTYKVYIIDDDVLNAFAAPGGNMYFYTGLIKFLDEEDDLMGVMGHEIAHADNRHSVKQMIEVYGVQLLLSIALGDNPSGAETILAQVAGTGAALKFSRNHETEADEYSVKYLAETPYRCDAASRFFQKLDSAGLSSGVPEFLSTHPAPENRIENIKEEAESLGCSTEYYAPESYDAFKAMLP